MLVQTLKVRWRHPVSAPLDSELGCKLGPEIQKGPHRNLRTYSLSFRDIRTIHTSACFDFISLYCHRCLGRGSVGPDVF